MPKTEAEISSRDGTKLFVRRHTPDGAAKAHVLVVHGYGDHSGRYTALLDALAESGFDALAVDLRGHGRSAGLRAMITRFDEYLDDVRAAHQSLNGGEPCVIFGHSMGGLVVTHYVAKHPNAAKAVMLSSPYYSRALKVNPLKLAAGHLLGRLIPKLALATGITAEHITHDPQEVAIYDADTLMNKSARAGWFLACEAAMAEAPDRIATIGQPLYMTHGEADEVAAFSRAKELFGRARSSDKTFVPLPGMRHEPLHEIERAKVIRDIVAWAGSKV